jgi:N-acyl-phosphatidylethanolamine-hydrolysing phospholipase D
VYRHRLKGNGNSPDTTPPTVPVHPPRFLPTRKTGALRATWLGHACWLVEFPSGLRVLFDPVFEHRCGPLGWLGPGRYTEPPCKIEEIPIVDAVVISHNHYDHLSHPTIDRIQKANPNVQFFAPLGNKEWFTKCGIHNMTELDWWESRELILTKTEDKDTDDDAEIIQATIGCLPCQHMSARTPFDRMHTLWGSWSVESGGKKLWFGGYVC